MYVGSIIFIVDFSILMYYLMNDNDNNGFSNMTF